MDLATALLWTLRILLPIVLFCVYFKLQAPKDKLADKGLSGNVHSRSSLLALRKAVDGTPAPPSMENIAMKSQDEAPQLFAGTRGNRGARRERDDTRNARGSREKPKEIEPSQTQEEPEAASTLEDPVASALEEKMHLESLLNYVAFNRTEQQRTFLLAENGAPPPPPPPPKKPVDESAGEMAGSTSEKANAEAQMVLRGALGIKRSDVALRLQERLSEAAVEISESTFELMIEVCLGAEDLKGASQFLMKMEGAGHLPRSALLDRVMNLYSDTRTARENVQLAKAGIPAQEILLELCEAVVPGEDKGARTQLSSQAPVFVPSFIPPPPPPDAKTAPDSETASPERGDDPESASPPSSQQSPLKPPAPRTKLTAASAAFEPQFKVIFVPGPSKYPSWGADGPHGSLPPGPVNMGKGSGFDGFEMSKGSTFEMSKGSSFEKGFEKGHNGVFFEKGFDKGMNGKGKEKGKGEKGQKSKGKGKGYEHDGWDDANGHEQGKGWTDSSGKGWGEADRKHWSADTNWSADKRWSSDSNWSAEAKWSPEASWDFDSKWKDSNPKKVWREKANDNDTEDGESNGGQKNQASAKWRPKAENAAKTEVDSKESETVERTDEVDTLEA